MQKPVVPPSAAIAIQVANVFNNQPRIAVIGLRVDTKYPAGKWKDVIEGNLFTDVELKQLWHEYRGRLNIGIACGKASQIVVVDADNAAGVEWVEKNLPHTPMQVRTKKGRHFYYRLADDVIQKNRTDILGSKKKWEHDAQEAGFDVRSHHYSDPDAQKTENERVKQAMKAAWDAGIHVGAIIDVRGTGGQVVGPFSKKDDGFEYTWVEPWTPELFERVPFWKPEWVSEELKWKRPSRGVVSIAKLGAKTTDEDREAKIAAFTDDEKFRRAKGWLARTPGAVEGQRGHDHTFYVACRLCNGFDLGPERTFELMLQWNTSCQPPWTEQELAHKIGDAMKHSGPGNGAMLEDRPEFLAAQKVKVTKEFVSVDYDDEVEVADGAPPSGPPPPSTPPPSGGGGPPAPKPTKNGLQWEPGERAKLTSLWDLRGVDFNALEASGMPYNVSKPDGKLRLDPGYVNLVVTLKMSKRWKNTTFRYNLLIDKPEINGAELTDNLEAEMRYHVSAQWNTNISKEAMNDALKFVCLQDRYEPGREWLDSLPAWDGVDRISLVPFQVLGAETNDFGRAVVWSWQSRCFFRSIVARMLRPGCKVDTVFVLQGEQAAMKSTFFQEVLPISEWFTDTRLDMRNKDSLMVVVKHYIIEWSEGEHAKTPARIDEVKEFVSRRFEDYRSPYDVHSQRRPRRCVFGATTNDVEILHDPTGSRRFHITPVASEINVALLRKWREQLFAQALAEVRAHWAAEERARAAHPNDPHLAILATAADPDWQNGRWWLTKQEEAERAAHMADFKARSAHDDFVTGWVHSQTEPFCLWDLMTAMDIPQERRNKRLEAELLRAMADAGAVPAGGGKPVSFEREVGSRRVKLRARLFTYTPPSADDQSF